MGMTGFSSTGCRSGSFTNSTRRSTPAQLSPMTVRVEQCLSVIAPRAFREAMRQAALLRVTVKLWSEAGISGGLIAQTTFLALTRKPYYAGRMRLSPSPGSPGLYLLPIAETAEIGSKRVCDIPAPLVLWDLARRKQHLEGVSTYHVWTSQEILNAEGLPLPGRLNARQLHRLAARQLKAWRSHTSGKKTMRRSRYRIPCGFMLTTCESWRGYFVGCWEGRNSGGMQIRSASRARQNKKLRAARQPTGQLHPPGRF